MPPILDVRNLETRFQTPEGEVAAVSDVSFSIKAGESLGVVGESGSGKTQIFMSLMGLLAKNGRCRGSVTVQGEEILNIPARRLNHIRGVRMSMIFQDPMTSLNPFLKISRQMREVLIEHRGMDAATSRQKSLELLDLVGIPEAKKRLEMYPHEFSGGMRQRVMIAMALLCQPALLIADEPTTALDVTVQAQILEIINRLKQETGTAVAMITHDLGVVAGTCDRVMVMYAGRIVESGPVREIFYNPQHPYTRGLLRSMPRIDEVEAESLQTIPGQPPNLQQLPSGCAFQARCAYCSDLCRREIPELIEYAAGHRKACHKEVKW